MDLIIIPKKSDFVRKAAAEMVTTPEQDVVNQFLRQKLHFNRPQTVPGASMICDSNPKLHFSKHGVFLIIKITIFCPQTTVSHGQMNQHGVVFYPCCLLLTGFFIKKSYGEIWMTFSEVV